MSQRGQEVPAKPRSPSQVKKSQPGQEVPARPRGPSQAKKSQPDQEVPSRPRCPIQAKKSQPGQEIPTRPRNSVRPKIPVRSRSPARSRSPWKVNKSCKVNIRKLQKLHHIPPVLFLANTQSISVVTHFPGISILHLHDIYHSCFPVKRGKNTLIWQFSLQMCLCGELSILVESEGLPTPIASWGLIDTHRITVI